MIELHDTLHAWGTDLFAPTLKREIEALAPGSLPLDRATAHGGRVDDGAVVATVTAAADAGTHLEARVGVFFSEVIAAAAAATSRSAARLLRDRGPHRQGDGWRRVCPHPG